MARPDPEELRALIKEGVTRKRTKRLSGLEARVADAWNRHTTHGNWGRLTPQWQRYITSTVRAVLGQEVGK